MVFLCNNSRRAHKRQMAKQAVERNANEFWMEKQEESNKTTTNLSPEFINLAFEEDEVMARTREINNVE